MTTKLPPLTPIETAAMQIVVALSDTDYIYSPIILNIGPSTSVNWKLYDRRIAGRRQKRVAVAQFWPGEEFSLPPGTISVSFTVVCDGVAPEFLTGGFVWDGTIPEKFTEILSRDCQPWR